MTRFAPAAQHLLATLLFVALALVWSFPLVLHLSSDLPGEPGDNLAFLWNTWWMRQAVASPDVSFFHTGLLFAPFGIDLTLHTHTALPGWIAATALAPIAVVTAQNLVILGSLAFNGVAAYLLAVDRTNDRGAGVLAGLIFAGSPYIAAHLLGHFNLIGAWGIPLFLLYFLRALERQSLMASLVAGLCLVATAFTDYYYLLYSVLLGAGLTVAHLRPLAWSWDRHLVARPLRAAVMALVAVDLALAGAIVATGGFVWTIGSFEIRANRPTNLLAIVWGLLAFLLVARYQPRLRFRKGPRGAIVQSVRALWPLAAVAALGVLPLIVRGWSLWQGGDYTAPHPSWRSGPGGVDLATLVLGNPWHPLWGGWTRDLYARLGINSIESLGWLGVAPTAMVAYGAVRHRRDSEMRRWLAIGGLSFLWALGPWLHVAGFDTGLLLPQNVLAFVPILSNARMPGRAMVVVVLATALIAARIISQTAPARRRAALAVGALVIVLDYLPAPFPLTHVQVPALYSELRSMGDGAVCELPVGVRDGFGVAGRFDDRVLSYQMVHGHPIVGGFAARVPDSIKRGYEEMPVVRSLFRLSAGADADVRDLTLTREAAGAALERATIEFVVLNRAAAPAPLVAYVESALPLELVTRADDRDLYVVYMPRRNAFMNGPATVGVRTEPVSNTSRGATEEP